MSRLGWEVKGIEPDPISASLVRRAGLEVHQGFVESAPLEPDSFDAITLNHVIEHLSHPIETLRKLIDALRPGGILVSISPNPYGILSRWFGGAWRGLEPPRHLVLPGPSALANMAKRFGLEPMVWTTSRNGEWMARESISILRYGDVRTYKGRWVPRLIAMGCRVLTVINGLLGEEVVLIARKV
jgi:SAM-dependent methyltransferase